LAEPIPAQDRTRSPFNSAVEQSRDHVSRSRLHATHLFLRVQPIGKVIAVSGAARQEKLVSAQAYGLDFHFAVRTAVGPLDSCIAAAAFLTALLIRRRAVVPFPFVAEAITLQKTSLEIPLAKT
jgi:hypothetical protein